MQLQDKLFEDMKTAMKSGDKISLETIRMLRSQIKNASLSKSDELTEEDILGVLSKEAKRRKESIGLFKQGGRNDLVEQETLELEIISSYLPEALSEKELENIVINAIRETGAESMSDMGKVMSVVMSKIKGRADGSAVQALVRQKLN